MRVIYEPKGRAREYAELAVNLYEGCSHGCRYCWGPKVMHRDRTLWRSPRPWLRKGIITNLAVDAKEMQAKGDDREVLLCFSCDPYHGGETAATCEALRILGEAARSATVLTKGGIRALRDIELFRRHRIRFGTSLVWSASSSKWRYWEPDAPSPMLRVNAIRRMRDAGVSTWVSLEPVIDADEALGVIEWLADDVDHWMVGPINYDKKLRDAVDWRRFVHDLRLRLDPLNSTYYLKRDLLKAAGLEGETLGSQEMDFADG